MNFSPNGISNNKRRKDKKHINVKRGKKGREGRKVKERGKKGKEREGRKERERTMTFTRESLSFIVFLVSFNRKKFTGVFSLFFYLFLFNT